MITFPDVHYEVLIQVTSRRVVIHFSKEQCMSNICPIHALPLPESARWGRSNPCPLWEAALHGMSVVGLLCLGRWNVTRSGISLCF